MCNVMVQEAGPLEVLRLWKWSSHEGNEALSKEASQIPGLFHHTRTQSEDAGLRQVHRSHQNTTLLSSSNPFP